MAQIQGRFRLERAHLQQLFDALTHRGYQIVGPTVRDRAIVYDQLNSVPTFQLVGLTSRTAAVIA